MTRAALIVLAAALAGCRLDRMTIREPVTDRLVEVESGDRFWVELNENVTTGYRWEASADDFRELVETQVKHIPAEQKGGEPVCGAPGKAEVLIRVHRGFVGPATVTLRYVRPWEPDKPARTVRLVLWKRDGDVAPWKD